jgi:glutathione synthase/RimK-type ligase-like ATP-grasp enzyme
VYDFCMREARAALLGSVLGLPARFMSRPENIWKAEFKPYQLAIAAQAGLRIPSTCISNCPDSVRQAYLEFGERAVVKPCKTGYLERDGKSLTVFTSPLHSEALDDYRALSLSPMIVQPEIPKRSDLRITVVGQEVFPVRIDSQVLQESRIDWRQSQELPPHHLCEIPGALRAAILDLMRLLGLAYGAIDFILTPEGEYVFLEINPNGQWLWVEEMLGLGISDAVATWLVSDHG